MACDDERPIAGSGLDDERPIAGPGLDDERTILARLELRTGAIRPLSKAIHPVWEILKKQKWEFHLTKRHLELQKFAIYNIKANRREQPSVLSYGSVRYNESAYLIVKEPVP